jgi:hypothetical protein
MYVQDGQGCEDSLPVNIIKARLKWLGVSKQAIDTLETKDALTKCLMERAYSPDEPRFCAVPSADRFVMTAEEALRWISDSDADADPTTAFAWIETARLGEEQTAKPDVYPAHSAEWCRANVMVGNVRDDASTDGEDQRWVEWNTSYGFNSVEKVRQFQTSPHVYKIRLLQPEFAQRIIAAADACNCYQSKRHQTYKTNDMPISRIPAVSRDVFDVLKQRLIPALSATYNLSPEVRI